MACGSCSSNNSFAEQYPSAALSRPDAENDNVPFDWYEDRRGESTLGKGSVSKGRKDGYWEFYYPTGELLARGEYVGGRRSGLWEFWHRNGAPLIVGEFGPRLEGVWVLFNPNGRINISSESSLYCENDALLEVPAGYSMVERGGFSHEDLVELRQVVLPLKEQGWNGTGVYKDGVKVRALFRVERQ